MQAEVKRFVSKPVEIEAIQLGEGAMLLPNWVEMQQIRTPEGSYIFQVLSTQGWVDAFTGDWLIRELNHPDRCYPCNPDVFEKKYLPVREKVEVKKELRVDKPILKYFKFEHLPDHLKETSRPFYDLAHRLAYDLPDNQELSVALRKLLEAKDAAVRARL